MSCNKRQEAKKIWDGLFDCYYDRVEHETESPSRVVDSILINATFLTMDELRYKVKTLANHLPEDHVNKSLENRNLFLERMMKRKREMIVEDKAESEAAVLCNKLAKSSGSNAEEMSRRDFPEKRMRAEGFEEISSYDNNENGQKRYLYPKPDSSGSETEFEESGNDDDH